MPQTKRVSRLTNRVAPAITLERDRRRDRRGPVRRDARVTVTGGLLNGDQHRVTIRDASNTGSTFYLKDALPIGTKLQVVELIDDRPHRTFAGEVSRVRPISNGRHEMIVRYDMRVDKPEIVKILA
jgi:hypothetical protein